MHHNSVPLSPFGYEKLKRREKTRRPRILHKTDNPESTIGYTTYTLFYTCLLNKINKSINLRGIRQKKF